MASPNKIIEELRDTTLEVARLKQELLAAEGRQKDLERRASRLMRQGLRAGSGTNGDASQGRVLGQDDALDQIVAAVGALPGPVDVPALHDHLKIKVSTIRSRIRRAVEDGLLKRVGRGKFKVSSTEPNDQEQPAPSGSESSGAATGDATSPPPDIDLDEDVPF